VLNPFLFRWSYLKRILRFSTKVQITNLTLVLNYQVDRTLIASVLGPTMLGFYALASRAASIIDGISHALMNGILPASSDLAALNQTARLQQLYFRASRYLAILDLGLCAGVGGLAIPLFHAWQGQGFNRSAITLMIILFGYALWLPSQATTEPLYGLERPEIRMRADIGFLMLHIPLSVVLLWRFGYFGTVVGTALALATTRIYVYVAGAHALGASVWDLLHRSFMHPAIAALIGLAVVVPLQLAGAPLSIPMLLVEGGLFCIAYMGYIGIFGLDPYDRDLVRAHIPSSVRQFVSRFRTAT
jgi:O-antigen/teichoic acid export membrane protein